MKLTKDQINQIKSMISKKGYPEIDVQYEILDHVACRIEKLQETNPSISIETAFQKVHAEFGIFGFSDLEESYKKVIEKRLFRYFKQELKSLFLSWKVLLPLGITFLFFQSAYLLEKFFAFGEGGLMLISLLLLLVFATWWFFSFGREFKKYRNYASWKGNQGILMLSYIPMQVMAQGYKYLENFNILSPMEWTLWQIIMVLFVFGATAVFTVIPSVLAKGLQDTKKLEEIYAMV